MGLLGSLVGLGSFASGALDAVGRAKSARDAKNEAGRNREMALGELDNYLRLTGESNRRIIDLAEQARDDAGATRSRVLGYMDDGMQAEVNRILEQRDQAMSRTRQDAISRGLFSSTASMALEQGVARDASELVARTGAQFTGARANADAQLSGGYQNALLALANVMRNAQADINALGAGKANVWSNAPIVQTPHPLSTAGQIVGSATSGAYTGYQMTQGGAGGGGNFDALLQALRSFSG